METFLFQHEDASINMFRHLLDQNPDVKAYLDQILEPEDYIFIAEAIKPVEEVSAIACVRYI